MDLSVYENGLDTNRDKAGLRGVTERRAAGSISFRETLPWTIHSSLCITAFHSHILSLARLVRSEGSDPHQRGRNWKIFLNMTEIHSQNEFLFPKHLQFQVFYFQLLERKERCSCLNGLKIV